MRANTGEIGDTGERGDQGKRELIAGQALQWPSQWSLRPQNTTVVTLSWSVSR